MRKDTPPAGQPASSPLSLSRLREAFAAMLGPHEKRPAQKTPVNYQPDSARTSASHSGQTCEISPKSVVEATLFVGRPDNRPFTSRELAAAMRGVSPVEIDTVVHELNALYDKDEAPYWIETGNSGYRLVLRKEFERMRDKFHGRVREAKLSPAALEVLSIIAYNQPISAERINEIRSAPNGAALSTLVRRRLVRLERFEHEGEKPCYSTTDRFLKQFGLDTLEALPRSEELEKT
jgi:segregation and condensation protein B